MAVAHLLQLDPKFHELPSGVRLTHSLATEVLEFIDSIAAPGMTTVETGAGFSTVVFARRGCHHTVIVPDPAQIRRIRDFCAGLSIATGNVRHISAKSQDALPQLEIDPVDIVLIDGSHSFPVAFMDYFYLAGRLKTGGVLVVDDTNIWTGDVMRKFLFRHPCWQLVEDFPRSVAFRKIAAFDPDEDWIFQDYVVRKSLVPTWMARARRLAWLVRHGAFLEIAQRFLAFRWLRGASNLNRSRDR